MTKERPATRTELVAALRAALGDTVAFIERARRGDPEAAASAVRSARALAALAKATPFAVVALQAARLPQVLEAASPREWLTQVDAVVAGTSYELERASRERSSSTTIPAAMSSARVLLVDPDPGSRAETSEHLQEQLVTVVTTDSVDDALGEARRVAPDVVFVDSGLEPASDVVRLAKELRRIPGCTTVPLAVVGRDGYATHRLAAAQAGISLYLQRPLDAESVGVALRQLLGQRRPVEPKLLILDDDPDLLDALSGLFRGAGIAVRTLDDPSKILDVLEEEHPDLMLVDVNMPEMTGYDVTRILRTSAEWQDLPIVVMTANVDVESQVSAFRAGADDFVAKEASFDEMLTRVRGRIERMRALRERGDRDVLTGLLRRGAFTSGLLSVMNQARRRGRPFAFAILDLDKFKDINDVHGHLAGDRVLVALGKLVASTFRAEDVRGRWGGEEIVIAFPDAEAKDVVAAIQRLLDDLRAIAFVGEAGVEFHAAFSAGVATFPGDGATPAELFAAADRRLYVAKRLGRGRIESKD